MLHSKKKIEGFIERKRVLESIYPKTIEIIDHALVTYRRKELAKDDILDAIVASVTAHFGGKRLISIPDTPEYDSTGLRMEILYTI